MGAAACSRPHPPKVSVVDPYVTIVATPGGARTAWRSAALIAGVPALAVLGYGLVFVVVGFPVSLIVLPFAAPVIAVSLAQVKAAIRTWQGVSKAAARLRNISLAVSVVIAGLFALSMAQSDDGVQRDEALLRERTIEKAIVVALMGVNALAVSLLIPTTQRHRPEPTTLIAKAAGCVLAVAVLVVLCWPRPHHG